MKDILLDIGNSSFCKLAVCDGGGIRYVRKILRDDIRTVVEDELGETAQAGTVCLSSVAGDISVTESWLRTISRKYIRLDAFTPMPLTFDYSTPESLGADRIAAAVGAAALFPGEDCLIFDLGTAMTVDFLSGHGRFEGGCISPGMNMRFSALHSLTSRLPLAGPQTAVAGAGKNTVEAISSGVVSGIMFEVEKYIENNPGHRIVFTGGDSLFFAKKLKSPIFVVCNLVLRGLLKIVQFNDV